MATCDYPGVRTPVPPLDLDMCIAIRLHLNPVHSVVNTGKGWSLVFYTELEYFFFLGGGVPICKHFKQLPVCARGGGG